MQLALMKVTRRVTSSKSTLLGGIFFTFFIITGSVVIDIGQVSAQTATLNIPLQYRAITPAERSSIEQPNIRNVYGSYPAVVNGSGTRTINEGFTNPRQSGEYSTGVFYAASARPSIPACAQNIEVRLGGNFTLRYRSSNGSGTNQAGPVGRWGNAYDVGTNRNRDYPEVFYRFFHSGAFWTNTAQRLELDFLDELASAGYPLEWTNPDRLVPAAYEFRVYSSPPEWHSVTAAQAEEFTLIITAEIMDWVANGGRQWSYNVTGNPELQVRWNNVACLRNRPYIQVSGGDTYSGARFRFGEFCDRTSANASIRTNGYSSASGDGPDNAKGSSMGQYAVFASGSIANSSPSNFFGNLGYVPSSSLVPGMGGRRDMLFAHEHSSQPGFFYGYDVSNRNFTTMPCINETTSLTAGSTDAATHIANGTGDLRVNGNVTINTPTTVTGRKTLYVDGNVTIQQNVTYQAGPYASAEDIPYLKIVARNIYIQANATTIDGHYVTQSSGTADSPTHGIIDTCSDASGGESGSGRWPTSMTRTSCRRTSPSFVVNGSLTARKVLWKRTYGTVGASSEVNNSECLYSSNRIGCSAEHINFSPEGLIAGMGDSATISSVPLSTIELSPVY